ncbi:hypothetical protein MKX01_001192 [Papaver californicum]|nr:hypothetical protein MKX01_001192 [Papaver californicum]
MSQRNVYSWSGIITVYTDHGYYEEAIALFQDLLFEEIKLEFFVFPVVLKACSGLSELGLGKQLHGHGFILNPFVVNGLVDVYRRCCDMRSAEKIFSKFSVRNLVSFNTMIVGYCGNDLQLEEGIQADSFTLRSALTACADLPALRQGKEIHSYAIRRGHMLILMLVVTG